MRELLESNGFALEADGAIGRFDDGSPNAGTIAIVDALLAIAEELRVTNLQRDELASPEPIGIITGKPSDAAVVALAGVASRVAETERDLVAARRRIADLESAVRALAPAADVDDHRALARRYDELHARMSETLERVASIERFLDVAGNLEGSA